MLLSSMSDKFIFVSDEERLYYRYEKFGGLKFCLYICRQIELNPSLRKMKNEKSFLYRVYHLYVDGFRQMTLGKTLWAIILVKLFVIFVVLKVFFFPNYLARHAEKGSEADFVSADLVSRVE